MKKLIISVAITVISLSNVQAQVKPETDWAQFKRYSQANAEIQKRPLAVLMGDSITDGWDNKDMTFFTDNNFACRGISGQTTSEMLVRFRQDVINLKPKYVVIMAGTNDIAQNNGIISLENILQNLISMCELAKYNKIIPILCSVPPADHFGWRMSIKGSADKIVKLNEMIQKYAKDNKIKYIDYHSAIKDENNALPSKFSGDGVHPNLDCYKIMEEILLKNIKK